MIVTFFLWTVSLALTFYSLFPRRWKVDETKVASDPQPIDSDFELARDDNDALSLEEFFFKSAQHKRRLLVAAAIAFWLGVICAALMLF